MEEKLTQEIKKQLLDEKAKIIEELSLVSKPDESDHVPGDYNPNFPDYGDDKAGDVEGSPLEIGEYEVNVDLTNKLQEKLDKIEEALDKIDKDNYGVCDKCGKNIPADRLKINPAALTCTNCG